MNRVRVEIFLSMHEDGAVVASFSKAQCAPPRAWHSSGGIRPRRGKPANSRSGLRLVYRGLDTPDLKEAKPPAATCPGRARGARGSLLRGVPQDYPFATASDQFFATAAKSA